MRQKVFILILAFCLSFFINFFILDSFMAVFQILTDVVLIINRLCLGLLIYFLSNYFLIEKPRSLNNLLQRVLVIYLVWLSGLLFGRVMRITDYDLNSHFNFQTFLPYWFKHLDNHLVRYYIIGNILVYIPLGMILRFSKSRGISFLYCLILISFLEIMQGVTNLGYFDIDDIILNGLGGITGIAVMDIFRVIFPQKLG